MSPRKKIRRLIKRPPFVDGFIPTGVSSADVEPVVINYEEYEAVKLADYEGLIQEEAAKVMGVSRPTFTRIYLKARQKIAKAFSELRPIKFDVGQAEILENWLQCNKCEIYYRNEEGEEFCPVCEDDEENKNHSNKENKNHRNMESRDKKREGECMQEGRKGNCICPKCGYKLEHQAGVPCRTIICPDCNVSMIRENSQHHKRLQEMLSNNRRRKLIAIPARGENKDSLIDKHFGKCHYFALYNIDDSSWVFEENPMRKIQKGSGIKALEYLVNKGVFHIISVEFGQKIKDIMDKSGITWLELGDKSYKKVVELIEDFKNA